MRLAVILVFATVVCGLIYFVVTHPNVERTEELHTELEKLEHQNEKLAEHNEELKRQIVALRDDPRLAERRAREAAGYVRPGELVFQFDEHDDEQTIRVRLIVDTDEEIELAGRPVKLEELSEQLEAIHHQIPGAKLVVDIDDEVGPVQRQRIIDLVDESPLGETAEDEQDE